MKQSLKVIGEMLCVDGNRDGFMTFDPSDFVTLRDPWRWWINDDNDKQGVDFDSSGDIPGTGSNASSTTVNGRRDLDDYFPIAINLDRLRTDFPPSSGYTYGFRQQDSAIAFDMTSMDLPNAFQYLYKAQETGYGIGLVQPVYQAALTRVGSSFTAFPNELLQQLEGSASAGVLLAEGVRTTTSPLQLVVSKDGGEMVVGELPMSISPVEQMYRWLNLRDAIPGRAGGPPSRVGEPPNRPDRACSGVNVIWVHGFNVQVDPARGWMSECFKRLYQSRIKAMFTGVTLAGDTGNGIIAQFVADFQVAVQNALVTAPIFAQRVQSLPGTHVFVSHSLGAAVVGGAIADDNLTDYSRYIVIDGAMAMEAYDATLGIRREMLYPTWRDDSKVQPTAPFIEGQNDLASYPSRLWASEWYRLFPQGDGRNTLTLRGRLGLLPRMYNMYSTGEEVLANGFGPIPGISESLQGNFIWLIQVWAKGLNPLARLTFGHDANGGWGFNVRRELSLDPNDDDPQTARLNEVRVLSIFETTLPPGTTVQQLFNLDAFQYTAPVGARVADRLLQLSDSELRLEPFFKRFDVQDQLTGSSWSLVASQRKDIFLSEAIPATTFAIGANAFIRPGDNNELIPGFDLNTQGRAANAWITNPAHQRWFHSDIKDVAYLYTYRAYDQIAIIGNLR